MDEHWFDALNKALMREKPRRTLLGTAALLTGLALDAPLRLAAKKRRKKQKKKRKKSKKSKANIPRPECQDTHEQRCSRGACRLTWNTCSDYDTEQRNWCEYVCEQCQVANEPFCIVGADVAGCCKGGAICCGGDQCVQLGTQEHCTGCNRPCRGEGSKCCPNPDTPVCVDTRTSRHHCGDCGQFCLGDDRECCNGSCEEIKFNNDHCNACNAPCPSGWECCHGICIDPDQTTCCDRLAPPFTCPASAERFGWCCTLETGLQGCCQA